MQVVDKMRLRITTLNCAAVQLQDRMQSGLQEECWRSASRCAECWCTLISVEMVSDQPGQRVLDCLDSAQR